MKPGDHLYTKRTGYTHHGIYVGDNTVIHYSGLSDGLTAGPIEECTLKQFRGSAGEYLIKKWGERIPHEATIERAYSRIGENEYNLLTNNCEHFAHWCVTGTSWSPQVISGTANAASLAHSAHLVYKATTAARVGGPIVAKLAGSAMASSATVGATTSVSTAALASFSGGSALAGLTGAVGLTAGAPVLVPVAALGAALGLGYAAYKKFFD